MQQTLITVDGALGARLNAYRQLIMRAETQDAPAPLIRLPGRETLPLGLMPGEGLAAAGALLAYALLGQEDSAAEERMQQAEQGLSERQLRRLCTLSLSMMRDDDAFHLPSLLACLRTAIAFLPEGEFSGTLPGIVQEEELAPACESLTLTARYAWAGDAAIAYFTLPGGCKKALVDGKPCTAAQCAAGVCLTPGTGQVTVVMGSQTATLEVRDPWQGLRLSIVLQVGPLFRKASSVPQRLWRRLPAWLCITGSAGAPVPELTLRTSQGESRHEAAELPSSGLMRLRCPALEPQLDTCVELSSLGLRYIDITGED